MQGCKTQTSLLSPKGTPRHVECEVAPSQGVGALIEDACSIHKQFFGRLDSGMSVIFTGHAIHKRKVLIGNATNGLLHSGAH
jgi:hypothetical protein